eukprot:GHVS01077235.1.p1 GENE.GHVS01077235.1~~GHVS01077235.1.p1  ORF type:complete len:892 (+),score=116.78 GHVS01077235.1:2085-4760(+)
MLSTNTHQHASQVVPPPAILALSTELRPIVVFSVTAYSPSLQQAGGKLLEVAWNVDDTKSRSWEHRLGEKSFDFFAVRQIDVDIPIASKLFDPLITVQVWCHQPYTWAVSSFVGQASFRLLEYLPWHSTNPTDGSRGAHRLPSPPAAHLLDVVSHRALVSPLLQLQSTLSSSMSSPSNGFRNRSRQLRRLLTQPALLSTQESSGNLPSCGGVLTASSFSGVCLEDVKLEPATLNVTAANGHLQTEMCTTSYGGVADKEEGDICETAKAQHDTGVDVSGLGRSITSPASPHYSPCRSLPQDNNDNNTENELGSSSSPSLSRRLREFVRTSDQQRQPPPSGEGQALRPHSLSEERGTQNDTAATCGGVAASVASTLPSGLPVSFLEHSQAFPATVIPRTEAALNASAFTQWIFAARGPTNDKQNPKGRQRRPCVDTELERALPDLHWRGRPLRSTVSALSAVVGFLKFVFLVEWQRSELSPMYHNSRRALLKYAFDEAKLYEHFREEQAVPKRVRLRLYIIKGAAIQCKTRAQLEVSTGTKASVSIIDSHEGHEGHSDIHRPSFWRLHEMDLRLPEEARLLLTVKDSNSGIGDDPVVGYTNIDLEDRWFSECWQSMMRSAVVPSEFRNLVKINTEKQSKGTLEMWLELIDTAKVGDVAATDLRPPAPTELELRVVAWRCDNIPLVDGGDHVDVQLQCSLDCSAYEGKHPTSQETDTHHNSRDGRAMFNWRFVFPKIQMPLECCLLQIRVMDDNAISQKTYIGEVNMDMRKHLEDVESNLEPYRREETASFYYGHKRDGKQEMTKQLVSVQFGIEVLTQPEADSRPVGLGRAMPNRDPVLTTPTEGREWGDVIGSAGFQLDFRLLTQRTRWVVLGIAGAVIVFVVLYLVLLVVK